MFIYPDNLKAKATLWLWELRDVAIIGVGFLFSVLAIAQTGILLPLVITVLYAFLSIRLEGASILDFLRYERYWELTDAEYLEQLEARRDEIIDAILERYQTKRKNLYVTGPAGLSIAKRFSVHRLCDKDGKNNLANRYVGELVERLIQEGRLVTAETRNGLGIRTATGAELRQREDPLPGQQQMTL